MNKHLEDKEYKHLSNWVLYMISSFTFKEAWIWKADPISYTELDTQRERERERERDKMEAFVGISQQKQVLYHNLMQRESAKLSYGN